MRWRVYASTILLVVISVCILCACNQARHPDCLIVLDGAKDVNFSQVGSTEQVYYTLKQPYPARAALRDIYAGLTKQGWKRVEQKPKNGAQSPADKYEWGEFLDGTRKPEEYVRQCTVQWTNARGDFLLYGLQYRTSTEADPISDQLRINAVHAVKKTSKEQEK